LPGNLPWLFGILFSNDLKAYGTKNCMATVLTFLKGLAMGICDTVPGISGGTIAFITGIYARLIAAIDGLGTFLGTLGLYALKKRGKKHLQMSFRQIDLRFLLTLWLGIITAVVVFSHLMGFLLEEYPAYVMAFFVGLIAISAIHIFTHIEKHHTKNQVIALIGLLLGVLLVYLVSPTVTVTRGYLFLSGILASAAMILPGISRSYFLLILGSYPAVIAMVRDIFGNFVEIVIFGAGILTGLAAMSKLLHHLFEAYKSTSLYFLVGLVIGSLSVPIRTIFMTGPYQGIGGIVLAFLVVLGGMTAGILMVAGRKR